MLRKASTTKSQVIAALKAHFKEVDRVFDAKEFCSKAKLTANKITFLFGSWEAALKAANLTREFSSLNQVASEKASFSPTKQVEKAWEIDKNKLSRRAEDKHLSDERKRAQKFQLLCETIEGSVAALERPIINVQPIRVLNASKREKSHCTLWFEFSDLQLGTLIRSEDLGGLNEHNWEIWRQKLAVWTSIAIEKIAVYKRDYVIDNVVIAMLGDMVEGQEIFAGQGWQIDRNVVDQAIDGSQDTFQAFSEIFLAHPDVQFDIFEVFGNHGRIGRKGESPYTASMDRVYQRLLQTLLKTTPEVKNYTYHQNDCYFYFVEIYGWNHLLLHGDQGMSKLWSNSPTVNGLEKGMARYNQMFQQQIHFLHSGHFHREWALSFNMSYMLINGSFIGTSQFSATQMVSSSPPMQSMHVFEPNIGLSKTERIHLNSGDVRVKIAPKTLARAK